MSSGSDTHVCAHGNPHTQTHRHEHTCAHKRVHARVRAAMQTRRHICVHALTTKRVQGFLEKQLVQGVGEGEPEVSPA